MLEHVIYDTETTGANTRFDQVLQAAAIKTDEDFVELDQIDIRSRLAPHIVPTAGALKVTHVDPYDIARAPYSAYAFNRKLHETFKAWITDEGSFDGFNTLQYDEEIIRQGFYSSLLDPYITTGRKRTRMDYLVVAKALHARNPEAMVFPIDPEKNKKSFRLEKLAPANGFTGHNAHDAFGDVRATIYLARLMREIDPHLFAHMLMLGNSGNATSFVEETVLFQLMGGPFLNPGVLDVCLVASQSDNPKNKVAWNLAIDPTPYLDASPEDLLALMRTKGTPFRTVKCNKSPAAFPMEWGFLNRVSSDTFEPAEPDVIEARAEMIRRNAGFMQNTAQAISLKIASYESFDTLEEKIYSGFPSHADKRLMEQFHRAPDWEGRQSIVSDIDKRETRAMGLRVIHAEAPEVMNAELREAIDQRLDETRFTLRTDFPWNTVGKLMAEIDEWEEKEPGDPEIANIRKWTLETYPIAHEWTGTPPEVDTTPENSTRETGEDEAAEEEGAEPSPAPGPDSTAPATLPPVAHKQSVHFLDGLS